MSSLSVNNLSKSYGGNDLFLNVSADVHPGARLVVVGPNGCGKSTMLKIIAGDIEADSGSIKIAGEGGIGYTAQELPEHELDDPILNWVLAVFPSWAEFWAKWEAATKAGDEKRLAELGAEQARLEGAFGYNLEHRAESVLHGLGFSMEDMHKPLRGFSGGWRERAKLARVLVKGTGILLLDEPTNHLDLEAVEWLENYLKSFQGAIVFVAHDRRFMDNVATHVLFLGGSKPTLRKGNFTDYLAWQEEAESVREKQAAKLSARIDHQMNYVNRFRVKARKAAQAQSKLRQVDKMKAELEELSPEAKRRSLSFSLPEAPHSEKVVLGTEELTFGFPGSKPLWKPLSFQIYRGQKIALVAPNGMGKSTLIKLLVGEHTATSGKIHKGSKTVIGYYSQHQTDIVNTENTVLSELRRLSDPNLTEEQLKSVLGLFMLGENFFDRKVGRLSGGEKSRLVLASLFLRGANFLVLDEPTNHLDLESREALVQALNSYDGTVLMVAHDRYLMTEVAEEAWALDEDGITVHLGGFEEYECKRAEEACAPDLDAQPQKFKRKMDKEEKRRQAELRNAIYRELKPLKSKFEKLEKELEAVAEKQCELETALSDPVLASDQEKLMQLTGDYQRMKDREDELFMEMAPLEEKILELEIQRDEIE